MNPYQHITDQIEREFKEHFFVHRDIVNRIDNELINFKQDLFFNNQLSPLLHLFIKGYKTYRSGILLILQGYSQDALVLCRTLQEILISSEYMLQDLPDRSQTFMRFYFHAIEGYLEKLRSIDPSVPIVTQTYVENHASREWGNSRIKNRAEEIGREMEYDLFYTALSKVAHPVPMGLNYFMQELKKEDITYFKLNVGPGVIGSADAIHYLSYFMVQLLVAVTPQLFPNSLSFAASIEINRKTKLFCEQIIARTTRILSLEFPNKVLPMMKIQNANYIRIIDPIEKLELSLSFSNVPFKERKFITVESLLGQAVGVYTEICKNYNRYPNNPPKNINAYL